MEPAVRTDLEVRGLTYLEWDPGTARHIWLLRGSEGAVHFAYADWRPDAPDEIRKIDTEFMIRFGHTLMPMGLDVGYHSPAPMGDYQLKFGPTRTTCEWLDDMACYGDGSMLRGRNLCAEWIAHDRDLDWLFDALTSYYNSVFRSDGDGPLELTELMAAVLGVEDEEDEGP